MTVSKEVYTMKWENSKFFELSAKEDNGMDVVIIHVDENSDIASIWPQIADICSRYLAGRIKLAGDQMVV